MSAPRSPDKAILKTWLDETGTEYYLCNQCEGLHLPDLQGLEGVVDSRLFQENYGVLLTTELEIRPMALLALSADLGRINMDYPTLKIFLDVVDDATPQLVVAGILPAGGGVTREQFAQFVALSVEGTGRLAEECLQLDYLFAEGGRAPPSSSLH